MLSSNAESTKASGSNTMSCSAFENGDIVLVHDGFAGYSTTNFNSTTGVNVMDFLNNQMDEPYSATAFYYTWDKWSCVKLPWVGWYEKANINIAVDVFTLNPLRKLDGICFPDSIKKSPNIFRFSYES